MNYYFLKGKCVDAFSVRASVIALLFFLFTAPTFAQTPTIDAGLDVSLCPSECTDLSATFTGGGEPINYTVSDIAFAPDAYAGTSVSLSDDSQTGLLPIGFDFCFYGNTYSEFVICSNNWIGFNTGETSTWVTATIPSTGTDRPHNCIMGPWHDINPGIGGNVYYQVLGTAPYRRLVVTYHNVPMFSCTGMLFTSQIIIYETTNIIENHIASKPICPTWNSGRAVQGLHNIDGTAAVVYPGRNNTSWDVTNHSVRYTPTGAPTVEWYEGPTLIATGTDVTVCPPATTTYTVNLISCGTIVATDDVTVTVNPLPTIDAGADIAICDGDAVTLTGTGAGVGGSYTWTGGVTDGVPFTPGATATYTVTGTDANGCENTDDITITVNPLPTVTATATPLELCEGETVTFTGGGADTYTWDMGVTDGVPFTPAVGTATYTVTGTDGVTGCENTATVDVTVNALPTVTASADFTEICLGDAVTFSGGGATSYTWDMGVTDGIPFTPAADGTVTYTVTGTDGVTGCENTATIDVTVYDNPIVTATATPDEICIGESITFTGGGAETYVWDGGITDGVPFTPAATGTFTYTVVGSIGASGCENTATVDITVNDLPTVTATADATEVCEGETVTLSGGGATTYAWDGGVTDGVAFTPTLGTTTFNVTGTTAEGCSNTASIEITVNPNPTVTAIASEEEICLGESVILTGSGATTYAWDGGATDGVPYTPGTLGTTTYTVTGTTPEGCSNTASVDVNVIDCAPVTADFSFDNNICAGQCISFTDESEGPVSTWAWDFGGASDPLTSDASNPTVCFNTVGTYTVELTVTSDFGLISTASSVLTVNESPTLTAEMDTIIDVGGEAVLIANTTSTGAYTWTPEFSVDCPDCPMTTASPQANTTYTVFFMDENGCSAYDTVMVWVNFAKGIGVPSAFTPNGDGVNDVLYVKGYGIAGMEFTIYNRYGQIVFQSSEQSIGWDGTFKNKDENPGVFTWMLRYTFIDGQMGILKGNTTLFR